MRGTIKMINNEEENKAFNEKLFDLIKVILKSKPRASIREVCNRIGMSKEGKLYTKQEIEECINMAIENGFLIANENGNVEENSTDSKNEKRRKFAEELKVQKQELEQNIRKENEAKAANKITGYHMKRNTPGKGR
jgi:ABC-type multidrug transport system ATPase subunit